MSLLQTIIDQVPVEARQKGVKCRGTGKVHFNEHNEEYISAIVECDGNQEVRLFRKMGVIEFGCTCRAHSDADSPCEHVWATLLQAESLGFLEDWNMRGWIEMTAMGDETVVEPV